MTGKTPADLGLYTVSASPHTAQLHLMKTGDRNAASLALASYDEAVPLAKFRFEKDATAFGEQVIKNARSMELAGTFVPDLAGGREPSASRMHSVIIGRIERD